MHVSAYTDSFCASMRNGIAKVARVVSMFRSAPVHVRSPGIVRNAVSALPGIVRNPASALTCCFMCCNTVACSLAARRVL